MSFILWMRELECVKFRATPILMAIFSGRLECRGLSIMHFKEAAEMESLEDGSSNVNFSSDFSATAGLPVAKISCASYDGILDAVHGLSSLGHEVWYAHMRKLTAHLRAFVSKNESTDPGNNPARVRLTLRYTNKFIGTALAFIQSDEPQWWSGYCESLRSVEYQSPSWTMALLSALNQAAPDSLENRKGGSGRQRAKDSQRESHRRPAIPDRIPLLIHINRQGKEPCSLNVTGLPCNGGSRDRCGNPRRIHNYSDPLPSRLQLWINDIYQNLHPTKYEEGHDSGSTIQSSTALRPAHFQTTLHRTVDATMTLVHESYPRNATEVLQPNGVHRRNVARNAQSSNSHSDALVDIPVSLPNTQPETQSHRRLQATRPVVGPTTARKMHSNANSRHEALHKIRMLTLEKAMSELNVALPISGYPTLETLPDRVKFLLNTPLQHALSDYVSRSGFFPQFFVELVRCHTIEGYRPNKTLIPSVLDKACKDYKHLTQLQQIAREGVEVRLRNPPPRQVQRPPNHGSALDRINILRKNVRNEPDAWRYLVLDKDLLDQWPKIKNSPFVVVDKSHEGGSASGRTIHDLSYHEGSSINDSTDQDSIISPDYNHCDAVAT
ncbi:hypothetical protein PHMEG_00021017 [Phytophthora megakarya]|uniref:Uncharacterized protein n=1 Tax=Phytophthora megakarya TaxID=4795 RepID=A0A225VP77_9STRA|nr:hypothetical protein PHMEG_00021017 [Phytophthora megakarya]